MTTRLMNAYVLDASILVQLVVADRRTAYVDVLPRALEIGLRHWLPVYDAICIALAKHSGYPLITDDARQATAAAAEGVALKLITDFEP